MSWPRPATLPSCPICSSVWGRREAEPATSAGRTTWQRHLQAAAGSSDGRPERNRGLRRQAARLQRQGRGRRLLLGRRPVVPLRHEQQGYQGGVRLLRDRPGGGRRAAHRLPRVRLLRGQRRARDDDGRQDGGAHEEGRQDLRAGDVRRRRPRLHARRRGARRQRRKQEGAQDAWKRWKELLGKL